MTASSLRFLFLLAPSLLLAALPPGPAAAEDGAEEAQEEEEGEEKPASPLNSFSIGLRGSAGREANGRDHDWGPTLGLDLLSSPESARHRFGYELEFSYNDAHWKLIGADSTQKTRVQSMELKYAKLSLLKLAGVDLDKRFRLVPYVSGGVQYVDSREETITPADPEEDEPESTESSRDRYWAPTFGAGVRFSLTRRTSLALDYVQNTMSGNRRIARLSFELSVSLFGEE